MLVLAIKELVKGMPYLSVPFLEPESSTMRSFLAFAVSLEVEVELEEALTHLSGRETDLMVFCR
jgi:hypothetical protein